jgi:hypothetical protein
MRLARNLPLKFLLDDCAKDYVRRAISAGRTRGIGLNPAEVRTHRIYVVYSADYAAAVNWNELLNRGQV